MVDTLHSALVAFTPELKASYTALVTDRFNRMVAQLGADLKNVYNDWTWARTFRETIAPNCRRDESGQYKLNPVLLAAVAEAYAGMTVANWEAKIQAKMGELDAAAVHHISGHTFRITGARGADSISIEQNMILNVSPKGKLFNQWPARIYVNGKFTSEAKFKKGGK
jgi:hypothetical protein